MGDAISTAAHCSFNLFLIVNKENALVSMFNDFQIFSRKQHYKIAIKMFRVIKAVSFYSKKIFKDKSSNQQSQF